MSDGSSSKEVIIPTGVFNDDVKLAKYILDNFIMFEAIPVEKIDD